MCTGREDRLLDCDFPEDFGYNNGGTPSRCFFRGGLDSGRLAVVCRSFEIAGTIPKQNMLHKTSADGIVRRARETDRCLFHPAFQWAHRRQRARGLSPTSTSNGVVATVCIMMFVRTC